MLHFNITLISKSVISPIIKTNWRLECLDPYKACLHLKSIFEWNEKFIWPDECVLITLFTPFLTFSIKLTLLAIILELNTQATQLHRMCHFCLKQSSEES